MISCEKEVLWFQKSTVPIWGIVDLRFQQAWCRLRFWSSLSKGRGDTGGWWNVLQIKTWQASWRRAVSRQELLLHWCQISPGTQGRNKWERLSALEMQRISKSASKVPSAACSMGWGCPGGLWEKLPRHLLCQKPPAWLPPPGEWWHLLTCLLDSSGCHLKTDEDHGVIEEWLTDKRVARASSVSALGHHFLVTTPRGLSHL